MSTITTLHITHALWREIVAACPHDGLEHGGKALGRLYTDGAVVACVHIGAGPQARCTQTRFEPDVAFQQGCYDGLVRRFPALRLVLDYHTHPDGFCALSALDLLAAQGLMDAGVAPLVLLTLTPDGQGGWIPNAFVVDPGSSGPRARAVPVRFIEDQDPRVRRLLLTADLTLRVFVPQELLLHIRASLLAASGGQSVDLYGVCREDEGLVQVLSVMPEVGLSHVGRAWRAGEGPTPTERELRLSVAEDGTTAAWMPLAGVEVTAEVEVHPVEGFTLRRTGDLVSEAALAAKRVVLVGLGSVGAALAELLAMAGVGSFTLLDPDHVSPVNLSRHPGDRRDLGRRKVEVMRERLVHRHPRVEVSCRELDVTCGDHQAALEGVFGEADLIVVSTDEAGANLAANRLAVEVGVPAVFVGIFDGGIGGEVFHRPARRIGCYACAFSFRALLPPWPPVPADHDYQALRPGAESPPMNALAIDIHHVVSVAASVALGLLGQGDRRMESPGLLLVAGGRPGWIFERAFEVIPATLADPGCPVCHPERADAWDAPLEFDDMFPLDAGGEPGGGEMGEGA